MKLCVRLISERFELGRFYIIKSENSQNVLWQMKSVTNENKQSIHIVFQIWDIWSVFNRKRHSMKENWLDGTKTKKCWHICGKLSLLWKNITPLNSSPLLLIHACTFLQTKYRKRVTAYQGWLDFNSTPQFVGTVLGSRNTFLFI